MKRLNGSRPAMWVSLGLAAINLAYGVDPQMMLTLALIFAVMDVGESVRRLRLTVSTKGGRTREVAGERR